MSDEPNGIIRYTTKELLAEIRDGISTIKAIQEGHEHRLTAVERAVADHQRLADENLPTFHKLVRELDVKREVSEALEERSDRGFTRREKVVGLVCVVITAASPYVAAALHLP